MAGKGSAAVQTRENDGCADTNHHADDKGAEQDLPGHRFIGEKGEKVKHCPGIKYNKHTHSQPKDKLYRFLHDVTLLVFLMVTELYHSAREITMEGDGRDLQEAVENSWKIRYNQRTVKFLPLGRSNITLGS